MYESLVWWILVQLVGVIALPLTFLLFPNLKDRGFPLSKPLGILILSYALWIGGTTRILPNSRGSSVILLILFLFASLFVFSKCRDDLLGFVRDNKRIILIQEILFLVVFLLWAFVRSYNPEIRATEQPMDFGFMNGIYRSEYFPPNDPWLAGHSISYYYFGYLMMATLAKLSGIATSVAYNLSLAMLFGLIAVGAFSIAYNLAARSGRDRGESKSVEVGSGRGGRGSGVRGRKGPIQDRAGMRVWIGPVAAGLLGALFVVGIGNLEGALELARAHNLGSAEFWRWVGIKDALQPYSSTQWYPTENWWWWRATRVINSLKIDVGPRGAVTGVSDQADYTIAEFPFFSFLLGDMHPHVMALPFALLAIGLSLNTIGFGKDISIDWLRSNAWRVALTALALGSLGFLNSWDFPTYTGLFVASVVIGMILAGRGLDLDFVKSAGALALAVGIGGVVLYVPFYVGFQSQASGILPVLGPGTQFLHFSIIWGLFLAILAVFLIVATGDRVRDRPEGQTARWWPLPIVVAPIALWALLAVGASVSGLVKDIPIGSFLAGRVLRILPIFILATVALFALDGWLRSRAKGSDIRTRTPDRRQTATCFAILLAAVGFALTLGCELFFIRDVFGTRMNTVFKFYYQSWILLALASSYGLYYVSPRLLGSGRGRPAGVAWLALVAVLVMGSLVYPFASVVSKTNNFAGPPTLDGTGYVERENPGEYKAIQWLIANAPDGAVVVEATGGQYTEFGRVSTRTGLPTILGWAGHEWQWRGSDKAYAGRADEIDTIYRSADRGQVSAILQKYGVTYVYAGHLERNKYGQAALDKFASFAETVFKNETVAIYRVRR